MIDMTHRGEQIQRPIVTAAQMQAIEMRSFDAGIPVPALMEKVGGKLVQRFLATMTPAPGDRIGILVGPGHNGGDALVMARELWLAGYEVVWYAPLAKAKPLTQAHQRYAHHLGIPQLPTMAALADCTVVIDGLFGFGLDRPITGELAGVINTLNAASCPVFSIDLPSGLQTDRGEVLGTAVRATHTVCLGLWKRAFVQAAALDWVGTTELLDVGLPWADVVAELGDRPSVQRLTPAVYQAGLPLPRPRASHKYQNGHLLIVAGSQPYRGAVILAGLAARASGVGMVTLAVPASISPSVAQALPEALVRPCAETSTGTIAQLPPDLDLTRYDAIAIGPGLTPTPVNVVDQVLAQPTPVIVDADGLNTVSYTHLRAHETRR